MTQSRSARGSYEPQADAGAGRQRSSGPGLSRRAGPAPGPGLRIPSHRGAAGASLRPTDSLSKGITGRHSAQRLNTSLFFIVSLRLPARLNSNVRLGKLRRSSVAGHTAQRDGTDPQPSVPPASWLGCGCESG